MRRLFPRHNRSFSGVAFALLAAVALPAAAVAQMQMDHGGPVAMSGAATFKLGNLTVTSPWTRATPGGAKIAGGYLKISNSGTTPDRFVGAKSEVADHAELHEMSMS